MTMDRHLEIVEKLEAFALGQLPEQERSSVEDHLAGCAACTVELRALNDVMEGLAVSVPPVPPPPSLRQRVLLAVTAEPQEPRDIAGSRATRRSAPSLAFLAAAAVLVLAIGAAALVDQSRRRLETDLSTLQTRYVELEERVARFGAQTDLALSILTAGDMREIPLTGRAGAAATAARAYLSPTRGLLVVADRLPAPPAGRVYQVWVIQGEQPTSAGLLQEEAGGRGMLIVTPPRPDVSGSITIAVTDEPPGGLPAPSGTVQLAGSI